MAETNLIENTKSAFADWDAAHPQQSSVPFADWDAAHPQQSSVPFADWDAAHPPQTVAAPNPPGAGEVFARKAVEEVGPSAAAAAGALTGGAALSPILPPFGSLIGALGGGISSYVGAKKLQTAAQNTVVGAEEMNRQRAELEAGSAAHPIAASAGAIAGGVPAMLSGGGVTKAAASLPKVQEAVEMGRAATLGQKAVRIAPHAAGNAAAFGVMEGGASAEQAVEEPGTKTAGDVVSDTARGMIAGGALSLLPGARTLLGKAIRKPAQDAAALAVSNAVYDSVRTGEPIDAERLVKEAGGNVPAFILLNAATALLPGAAKARAQSKLTGEILRAYGVDAKTVGKMTPEERESAYNGIMSKMTPEAAARFRERAPELSVEAKRQADAAPGADFESLEDPNNRRDAKAEYLADTAKRMFGKVNVRLYDTQADMIANNPDIPIEKGTQHAFYDPADKSVSIALDGITTRNDALRTLIHEAGGHAAIDAMSPAERSRLLAGIGKSAVARAREVAKKPALKLGESPDPDEVIAVLNEQRDINPSGYQRAVAGMREYARKAFPGLKLSDSDIDVMLSNARKGIRGAGGRTSRVEVAPPQTLEEQAANEGAFSETIPKPETASQTPPPAPVQAGVAEEPIPPPVEPPPTEKTRASAPVRIPKRMERDLRARGFTQEAINKMTPQEANDLLSRPAPAPEVRVEPPVVKPTEQEVSNAAEKIREQTGVLPERQGNGEGGAPAETESGRSVRDAAQGQGEGAVSPPEAIEAAPTPAPDARKAMLDFLAIGDNRARATRIAKKGTAKEKKAIDNEFAEFWKARQMKENQISPEPSTPEGHTATVAPVEEGTPESFPKTPLHTGRENTEQIQTPRLGDTAANVWKAWRDDQSIRNQRNDEIVVGQSASGTFSFSAQGKLEKVGLDKNGVAIAEPLTAKQEDEVFDDLLKGYVQIERRKVTGALGLSTRVDRGKTVAVLHQATGQPLDRDVEEGRILPLVVRTTSAGKRIVERGKPEKYVGNIAEKGIKTKEIREITEKSSSEDGKTEIAKAPREEAAPGKVTTEETTGPTLDDLKRERDALKAALREGVTSVAPKLAAAEKRIGELEGAKETAAPEAVTHPPLTAVEAGRAKSKARREAKAAQFRTKLTPAEEYQEKLKAAGLSDKYVQVPQSTEAEARRFELFENLNYAAGRSPRDIQAAKDRAEKEYAANPTVMQLDVMGGKFDGSKPEDMARANVTTVHMLANMFKEGATERSQEMAQLANWEFDKKKSDVSFSMNLLRNRLNSPDGRMAELSDLMSKPNDIEAEKLRHTKDPKEIAKLLAAGLRRAKLVIEKLKDVEIIDSKGNKVKFNPNDFTPEQLMDDTFLRNATMAIREARSTWMEKGYEWWRNSILSGLPTLLFVNPAGNAAHIAEEMRIQRPVEIFLNSLPGFKSADAPTKRSTKAHFKYAAAARQMAVDNFLETLKTETPQIGPQANKFDIGDQAIPGKFGKGVRLPQTFLTATDQFFRTPAQIGGAADFATRKFEKLVAEGAKRADGKPLSEADYEDFLASEMREGTESWNKAEKQASRWLLQEDPTKFMQAAMSLRNIPFFGWFWKYTLPFITTPANAIKTAARKSILGSVPLLHGLATGRYSGTESAKAEGIRLGAEQAVAWATTAVLYALTRYGFKDENDLPYITGNAQTGGKYQPGEREFEQRNLPPMSIRIGDKWYSYSRLDPFGTALAATVDLMNAFDSALDKNTAQVSERLQNLLVGTFSDKTYIKTVGDILDAVRNGDPGKWSQIASGTLSGFMPNLFKSFMRASDEYVRDMRNREKGEGYAKTAATRLLQQTLPIPALAPIPKYDIYGRPVERVGGIINALSPVMMRRADRLTKVDVMLKRYTDANPEETSAMIAPPKPPVFEFLGHKGKVTANDAEFEKFQKLAGEAAAERLSRMSFDYENPTERDIDRVHKVFEKARKRAKTVVGRDVRERVMNTQV